MISKFPLKVSYAIIAGLELALNLQSDGQPLQAKIIAQRGRIPARFIEQVLSALRQAGIVGSLRGAQGGYFLTREPSEISLADMVKAMNLLTDPSPVPSNGSSNGIGQTPTLHDTLLIDIWKTLHDAELAILESVSLQTLVTRYQRLEQQQGLMYHI